jgi:hypothetical protein
MGVGDLPKRIYLLSKRGNHGPIRLLLTIHEKRKEGVEERGVRNTHR